MDALSTIFDSAMKVLTNLPIAIIIIWVGQRIRYWYYLKRKFHNRTFETYWKRFPNDVAQIVNCKVKGNKIKFDGYRVSDKAKFEGEFIINPINLSMGEGFHTHTESDAFGFAKIIIRDNTFYVESPYTGVKENQYKNKEGFKIYQAFVWKRK